MNNLVKVFEKSDKKIEGLEKEIRNSKFNFKVLLGEIKRVKALWDVTKIDKYYDEYIKLTGFTGEAQQIIFDLEKKLKGEQNFILNII